MEENAPKTPITQEVPPEVKDVSQTPPQPPTVPQTLPESAPPAKPKKRLAIIIILLILIGLGVGGFIVLKYFIAADTKLGKDTSISEIEKTEKEVNIYRGIWMPTLTLQDPNHLASNVEKLKGLGVNTVFIQASPPLSESWFENLEKTSPPGLVKRVREVVPIEKELIIANIQTAHRNSLKVGLTISSPPGLEEVDLEALNSRIVEYAILAEEYDVELFAPMNEPEKILENIGKWRQEILLKIKEVYHGDIVWKGTGPGLPNKARTSRIAEQPPGDFSGYDYIGFSLMFIPKERLTPEEQLNYADMLTLEDYSQHVENAIDYELALAERDGVKGVIITEFGIYDKGLLSEEEIARTYEIVLEKGKDKVVGFIAFEFLRVKLPGVSLIEEEDLKTQDVIKKYFTEIL